MFDGVPADQFHQFVASRTSLPIPLSFPLHGSSPNFPSFDPYTSSHQTLQSHLLHQLHHQSPTNKDEEKEESSILSTNLELEREISILEPIDPWSNDEVLALLRIRSSVENWFPDLTWENVSRKLAELGYKRSAEKCKEKFEEETRNFNSITYNKSNRFFSELEDFYHGENPEVSTEKNQPVEKPNEEDDKMGESLEEDSRNVTVATNPSQENEEVEKKSTKSKKRKRKQKFELFKGFCKDIVNRMMAQQEELHNKLLEDMVNRDERKIAREKAWMKQEVERIKKEIEIRAQEQAIAGDRQATIMEFLKKFASTSSENQSFGLMGYDNLLKVANSLTSPTSPSVILPQNPSSTSQLSTVVVAQKDSSSLPSQNNPNLPTSLTESLAPTNPTSVPDTNIPKVPTSSSLALASQNPNSSNTKNNPSAPTPNSEQKAHKNPNSVPNEREDTGKRWPRDEVLALINMRCSLFSSNEDKEGAKGSLWERISQGMLELGYKRSAKRCKEKWENINKYFRKTKDVNKKRSVDSRTCPYFHQLSSLYNKGTIVAPPDGLEKSSTSPPNIQSAMPDTSLESTQAGSSDANMHVVDGGKNVIHAPAFNFEF